MLLVYIIVMDEQINASNAGYPAPSSGHNTPEMSVSDISNALKKTVEQTFSHVRVRGELSKVTLAKSGHLYTSLKDENAVLDAICWRGTVARLSVKAEEGLEVICTGRLTTYPGRSNYQLIIESMELAGEGALLKMLEDRKKKLAAEGLFDPARKKPLPFLPTRIGIVTSPTGAVIRDILHRINDRFPVPVYLWPVMVQGQGAAQQVAAAIRGFNDLPAGFDTPDLLIVARGGGSLEDLMPFNEESVVRAIAESRIPVISAIGHETDVTLADFAADMRAPTPTGAAEMAVPVRRDWLFTVGEYGLRMGRRLDVLVGRRHDRIGELSTSLSRFPRSLDMRQQRYDYAASNLSAAFAAYIQRKDTSVTRVAGRLLSPAAMVHKAAARLQAASLDHAFRDSLRGRMIGLKGLSGGLKRPDAIIRNKARELGKSYENFMRRKDYLFDPKIKTLHSYERILETLSFKNVLKRGYSVVRGAEGTLITSSAAAQRQNRLHIEFADGQATAIPDLHNQSKE